ncbi:DUF5691 domain-containing protein [Pseudomonas sp. GCM10022188]|uniref:DUF5691 domain-containing protein n=1 Tax=Pseudomonas TaxID=286 RepID=UPI001E3670A4|nr:DUF5691 domain-containing protein [Pseudomonas oryzagri]MCC6075894.1 DUF5691 domain-containing protein [Pseudomonas oryzagri]
MSRLEPLAVTALLGTRKQKPAPLPLDGEIATLLAAIAVSPASDEAGVLRTAAVLDICQQAGWVAPDATTRAAPPAPADAQALPPAAVLPLLPQMFAEGYERLGQLTLLELARHRLRLPPVLLADLLEKARRDDAWRGLVAPVLGERGRWLAERNPAWQVQASDPTTAPDDEAWEFGSLDQRVAYLSALRVRDPAAARERFAAALKELDARERATLARALAAGLAADDEALLEKLRGDRSKEVRRVAVDLLAWLPGSAYRQRMNARLAQCIAFAPREPGPGGLKGLFKQLAQVVSKEPAVRIEPPEAFFADGKEDQLEEAVPGGEGLGQRAWWLYQVVAATPLQWWREHGALSCRELVAAVGGNDWEAAMLRGWYQATLREGDAEWAAALLDRLSANGTQLARSFLDSQPLIALLPLDERERHWLHIAANIDERNGPSLSELLGQIVDAIPIEAQPGADFCRQLLPHLRNGIGLPRSAYDYNLRQAMRAFATLLPLETFTEARQGWPDGESLGRHQREAVDDWRHTLTLRENLQQLLD